MTKGVIFDMDGVLADTEHFYQLRRDAFLDKMDYPGPRGVDFVGSNEAAIWETLVPQDEVLRAEMLQGYRAYRKLHPENYAELVDPRVRPLFAELKRRGVKVAIASSSDREGIGAMVKAAGIEGMADYIISGEECTAHKPAPEIYRRALAALGLKAEQAFAVEDSPTGIASALAAGLRVYALRPRHGEGMDQSAATQVIDTLDEVLEKLEWKQSNVT